MTSVAIPSKFQYLLILLLPTFVLIKRDGTVGDALTEMVKNTSYRTYNISNISNHKYSNLPGASGLSFTNPL